MPFKSKKQEQYLRLNEPEVYRDWKNKYGSYKGAESFNAEGDCKECYGTGGLYDSHMGINDECRSCEGTGFEAEGFDSRFSNFNTWSIPKDMLPKRYNQNKGERFNINIDEAQVVREGDSYTIEVYGMEQMGIKNVYFNDVRWTLGPYPYTANGWNNGYMKWAQVPMRGRDWATEVQENLGDFTDGYSPTRWSGAVKSAEAFTSYHDPNSLEYNPTGICKTYTCRTEIGGMDEDSDAMRFKRFLEEYPKQFGIKNVRLKPHSESEVWPGEVYITFDICDDSEWTLITDETGELYGHTDWGIKQLKERFEYDLDVAMRNDLDKYADLHRCYQTLAEGNEPNEKWYMEAESFNAESGFKKGMQLGAGITVGVLGVQVALVGLAYGVLKAMGKE